MSAFRELHSNAQNTQATAQNQASIEANLFAYLSAEEPPINPLKQRVLDDMKMMHPFPTNNEEEDMDKENRSMKSSKILDDFGRVASFLVDRKMNSQLSSTISDTKSFYRVNGLLVPEVSEKSDMEIEQSSSAPITPSMEKALENTNNAIARENAVIIQMNEEQMATEVAKEAADKPITVNQTEFKMVSQTTPSKQVPRIGFTASTGVMNSLNNTPRSTAFPASLSASKEYQVNASPARRDLQLRDWQEARKNFPEIVRQHVLDLNRRNEFKSTAQIALNILLVSSRDGKNSAPAKSMLLFTQSQQPQTPTGTTSSQMTPTKPISPKLLTQQRSIIHALKNKQESEIAIEGSDKKPSSARKIDPKNFFLETERRALSRSQTPIKSAAGNEDSCEVSPFRARPMPEYKPFSVSKADKPPTEFKEFVLSTEERGRLKESQLKSKLENQRKQEELSRCFTALEIPEYLDFATAAAAVATSSTDGFSNDNQTNMNENHNNPSPLKVSTDNQSECTTPVRVNKHKMISESSPRNAPSVSSQKKPITSKSLTKSTGQNNNSNTKSELQFRAKKMPDFSKMKDLSRPSPKQVTVPKAIRLSSTLRAEERRLFDEKISSQAEEKQIQAQIAAATAAAEIEKEKLRLSPFKAQPIKKYKPVEIKRSIIPLTKPESPKFKTDARLLKEKQATSAQPNIPSESTNPINNTNKLPL